MIPKIRGIGEKQRISKDSSNCMGKGGVNTEGLTAEPGIMLCEHTNTK
jgi:hypothetical protein